MRNINLVIGCVHSPFENKVVWTGVLKLIRDLGKQLQGVYLIGDILDLNSLSFHEKGRYPINIDGKPLTIQREYKMVKVFDQIDDVADKGIKKYFLYGNHETRHTRHSQIPDNDKIIIEPPEEYFRLRERGYEVKTSWKEDYFKLGEFLEVFHGEMITVNPAKRQLDKLKGSCMFAHSHRAGVHYDGSMASYNIGCLVDTKQPVFDYAGRLTKRNWINGFGQVTIDDEGYFYANIITAYRDKFFYNGKRY